MAVKALDVANFYILHFKDSEDPMTKVRLQKFIYYAQAETLVRLNRPLFEDEFQAWHFGPVVPRVSSLFKDIGNGSPIVETVGDYDPHVFSPNELEILIDVANYCGKYSTAMLSYKTHVSGGPWDVVHKDTGEPRIIPKEFIQDYYSCNDPIPHTVSDAIDKLDFEGRVDSEGRFILPSDWE